MAAFASAAELGVWLQQDTDVDAAQIALDAASGAIRSHCGWSVSSETVTGYVTSSYGRRSVWLPTLYLTAVTSVVEDGVTLVVETDYDWTSDGRILRSGSWSTEPRKIVVTFTHGYPAAHPVLAMVKGVCLSVATRLLDNPAGVRSWTVGDLSTTYAGGGPDVVGILTGAERMQLPVLRAA